MEILVTGSAGFIGSEVALHLLDNGHKVVGVDNLNPYYDVNLKCRRIERLEPYENYTNIQYVPTGRTVLVQILFCTV